MTIRPSAVLAGSLLGQVDRLQLHASPFGWAVGELDAHIAEALAATFPTEGFTPFSRDSGPKSYSNESWTVLDEAAGIDHVAALPDLWADFVHAVVGEEYRANVGSRLGVDLTQTRLEVRLVRHRTGGHLGPHTDRDDKVLTQLWYFSGRQWDRTWGGRLVLLSSQDPSSVVHTMEPTTGRTVILMRSEDSWHAVEAVTDAALRPRLSALIHFRRDPGGRGRAAPVLADRCGPLLGRPDA